MMGVFETRVREEGEGGEGMVVVEDGEEGEGEGGASVPNVRVAVLAINTQVSE
jgi:hypothetical protein